MSAIAITYLMDREKIPEMKEMAKAEPIVKKRLFGGIKQTLDPFWEWFRANAVELETLQWSGFVFNSVLAYLAEKKGMTEKSLELNEVADCLSSKSTYALILFGPSDKARYLESLNPAKFPIDDLKRYAAELEEREPPPDEALVAALKMLYDGLTKVDDKHVMIFEMS